MTLISALRDGDRRITDFQILQGYIKRRNF